MRFVNRGATGHESVRTKISKVISHSVHVAAAYNSGVSIFYSKTAVGDEDPWLAKSGASVPLTNRREFLTRLVKADLRNVLFISELHSSLFSFILINDKKFSFHAYEHHCEVRDKKPQLTSRGVRHDKLFKMNFEVEVPLKYMLKL